MHISARFDVSPGLRRSGAQKEAIRNATIVARYPNSPVGRGALPGILARYLGDYMGHVAGRDASAGLWPACASAVRGWRLGRVVAERHGRQYRGGACSLACSCV